MNTNETKLSQLPLIITNNGAAGGFDVVKHYTVPAESPKHSFQYCAMQRNDELVASLFNLNTNSMTNCISWKWQTASMKRSYRKREGKCYH